VPRESEEEKLKISIPIGSIRRVVLPSCLAAALTTGVAGPIAAEPAAAVDSTATTEASPAEQVSEPGDPESAPTATIERFHAGLLEIMKRAEELGFQGRIDELRPLMARTFDLDFMASRTVGSHWRRLSDEDKARWAELFARLTTANYAGRFTGFKGEEFVTLGVQDAARGTRMVLTRIVIPGDDDVELNYRLLRTQEGWKVIDVYLDGTVSELALRRSEYSSALQREGFEELLAAVESKIENLKAKGRADG